MTGQTAIIIPARYDSTRLKGKPLIIVNDKPIIQWVFEKAVKSKLADRIIIATDNQEIYNTAIMFGAEAEMTSDTHQSGSDRIAEVVEKYPEISYIVNLQGDEPLITPESIDQIIKGVKDDKDADISTLVRVLTDKKEIENPNCVKCARDLNGYALYFSRSKIPYERNEGHSKIYGHLGIYGYKREALLKMTKLPQTSLELAESLEQLRALQNGMKIKTFVVDFSPVGIDTAEDLEKFKEIVSQST
ncbi:MAG TPA: 3-deoxy-manno-octulosonate cytidylyltransferase [Candidatus Gastranaerophilaceae bacterium]|mgnify:CR=1 FL=1|nr:3-deoxy-manno-octulosonate cytidylyltransferase [Candidatus Gastranaerophilaceae bacterium]HPT41101.1 3-deoxy-manno-octulosonate cytidylyltransferase [Candidatus Gastranaerophilaceae bacterium]